MAASRMTAGVFGLPSLPVSLHLCQGQYDAVWRKLSAPKERLRTRPLNSAAA